MSPKLLEKIDKLAALAILLLAVFGGVLTDGLNLLFGNNIAYVVIVKGSLFGAACFLIFSFLIKKNKKYTISFFLLLFFFLIYSMTIIHQLKFLANGPSGNFRYYDVNQIIFLAILGCFLPTLSLLLTKERSSADKLIPTFTRVAFLVNCLLVSGMLLHIGEVFLIFSKRFAVYSDDHSGPLIGPLSVASAGAISFLTSLSYFFASKVKMKFSFIAYVNLILGLTFLLVAGTRSLFLISMISTSLMGFRFFIKSRKKNLLFLVSAMGMMLLGVWYLLSDATIDITLLTRLSEIGSDGSSNERLKFWGLGLGHFADNPIFGSYVFLPGYGMYPHNIFIEALMATGLVGSIPLLIFIILTIRNNIRKYFSWNEEVFLPYIFLAFFFFVMFSGAVFNVVTFWVLTAYTIRETRPRTKKRVKTK